MSCFDNDQLCIDNICRNFSGFGLKCKNITVADSPYTASLTEVTIFANTSGGNITINLQNNSIIPNQVYIIKKTDSSTNTVTIIPPIGDTIDGVASYVLCREDEVVKLQHCGTDWKVIEDKLDRLMIQKGDLITRNDDCAARLPVGMNGQVLQADSTLTLGMKWVTLSSVVDTIAYTLLSFEAVAPKITYQSIGVFPWLNSRYSGYMNGTVIYQCVIGDRNLDIRLQDVTNAVTLGSDLGVAASGARSFTVINPTTDAIVELQVRKSANGGTNPSIFGASLEYDK